MMKQRHVIMLGGIFFALLVWLGSSTTPAQAGSQLIHHIPPPDRVIVTVERVTATQVVTIFSATVTTDAASIWSSLTLDPPLTELGRCPLIIADAPYYHYTLVFYADQKQVASASSNARGCQRISVMEAGQGAIMKYSWYHRNAPSFWVTLRALSGAPTPI